MKFVLSISLLFSVAMASAQSFGISEKRDRLENVRIKDSTVQKKWFVSTYSSVAIGFIGFNGGSASYIASPMGIQLNRTLDNNWTAFAGLSLSPTFLNYNQRFTTNASKGFSNSFMAANPTNLTVNPAVYAGIGYTNDARTFQIQGRISVQQGNYFTNPSAFGNSFQLDRQMNNLPFQNRAMNF